MVCGGRFDPSVFSTPAQRVRVRWCFRDKGTFCNTSRRAAWHSKPCGVFSALASTSIKAPLLCRVVQPRRAHHGPRGMHSTVGIGLSLMCVHVLISPAPRQRSSWLRALRHHTCGVAPRSRAHRRELQREDSKLRQVPNRTLERQKFELVGHLSGVLSDLARIWVRSTYDSTAPEAGHVRPSGFQSRSVIRCPSLSRVSRGCRSSGCEAAASEARDQPGHTA